MNRLHRAVRWFSCQEPRVSEAVTLPHRRAIESFLHIVALTSVPGSCLHALAPHDDCEAASCFVPLSATRSAWTTHGLHSQGELLSPFDASVPPELTQFERPPSAQREAMMQMSHGTSRYIHQIIDPREVVRGGIKNLLSLGSSHARERVRLSPSQKITRGDKMNAPQRRHVALSAEITALGPGDAHRQARAGPSPKTHFASSVARSSTTELHSSSRGTFR